MKIELILVLLVLLVIAGVVIGNRLKKKHYATIDRLDKEKSELFSHPVAQDFFTAEQTNLTGQSKTSYEQLAADWQKMETVTFPSLENLLFAAEQAADRFLFPKASTNEKEAEQLLQETKGKVEALSTSLKELLENEEKNREEGTRVEQDYQQLRNELLTNSFTYGTALEAMENRLTDMETDFSRFKEATASHDHMQANEVLKVLKQKINELTSAAERIPSLFDLIEEEITPQMEEIVEAGQEMGERGYLFPERPIGEKVTELQQQVATVEKEIDALQIEEAESGLETVSAKIDSLYDEMENEIRSEAFVQQIKPDITAGFSYLKENNRKLRIETDRLNQSYVVNEEELDSTQAYKVRLEELETTFKALCEATEEDAVFSEVRKKFELIMEEMDQINEHQEKIKQHIHSLREEEKEAKKTIEDFQTRFYGIRRFMEMQRLPGLPDHYLDLYFETGERLDQLKEEAEKNRIDLEKVRNMLQLVAEDLDQTKSESDDIIDQALLTEYLVQYLNRYRKEDPGIAGSIETSMHLFTKEFDYEQALEILAQKLEEIEPGAYEQILKKYEQEKQNEHKRS